MNPPSSSAVPSTPLITVSVPHVVIEEGDRLEGQVEGQEGSREQGLGSGSSGLESPLPKPANPKGQSNPGQSNPGQSNPGQSNPGQSNPGQSNPGQSNPGQSNPGQSKLGQSNLGRSNLGQSKPEQSNLGQSKLEQSNLEQSNLEQSNLEQSNLGQSNLGQSNLGQEFLQQKSPAKQAFGKKSSEEKPPQEPKITPTPRRRSRKRPSQNPLESVGDRPPTSPDRPANSPPPQDHPSPSDSAIPENSPNSPNSPPDCPPQPPALRPYQADVINQLYAKVRQGLRRIVIIAGTGAGKTVISGQICAHAESKGSKLLFLVHLDVLVGQTYEKMQAFGLHCGFIKAGWPEDPSAPIQIASIQTMAKRNWWKTWPADVVFYDEGHTTVFSQVGQQVLYETHPQATHIAMTATPYRLGESQLGDHFEDFVAAPPPTHLQRLGFLAPITYYGLPLEDQINLGSVQTIGGDYEETGLKNACDRPELIQRIVQEWQRLTPGLRTIAFCVDVEHAHHVAAAFQSAGVPAAAVDGGTPPKIRQELYRALAQGDLLVLASCNVLSIGFDVPAVEVGLLLRPTLSLALHYQQIGRVMRISPATGKTHGIILDQAGNLQRLGFPEDVQGYSLPQGASTAGDRPPVDGLPPNKQCPQCQRWVAQVHMDCPGCGYDWAIDRPLYTDDLIQLLNREQLRQIDDEPTRYRLFQGLRRYFFHRNYAPDVAKQEYFDCFQCWPPLEWYRGAIFGKNPTPRDHQTYRYYLAGVAQRLGRSWQWIGEEWAKEFGEDR